MPVCVFKVTVCGKCEMSSSSSFNDEDILLAVVAHEYQRTERSMWVHEIKFKRGEVGEYFHLFPDLLYGKKKFFKYFRTLADRRALTAQEKGHKLLQAYFSSLATSSNTSLPHQAQPLPTVSSLLTTCLAGHRNSERWHLTCRAEAAPIQCAVSHKIKCMHFKFGGRCRSEPADSVLIQCAPCLKRPKI